MSKTIEIKNLGKKYIVSHEKEALVRHILPRFLGIKKYAEFWALKGIDLKIEEGECLGIIGRNGAGKSTLLSILAGITFPTEGQVKIDGKVAAILSLGAGFHQELTGEENIYLNAAILGLSPRDIKNRFADIVDFAELQDFIDAPLKTYSSGMYVRLGFSIAVNVDFDILLIDEILSVGDIAFQKKCIEKLKEFSALGKTLIMTSQSLSLIGQLASWAVLLERGKISSQGKPRETINQYEEMMGIEKEKKIEASALRCSANPAPVRNFPHPITEVELKDVKKDWGTRTGTGDAEIKIVKLLDSRNQKQSLFKTGSRLKIQVDFFVHNEVENPHFGVAIFKDDGTYCYGPNTRFDGIKIPFLKKGKGTFFIEYPELNLLPGKYKISVAIWEKDEKFAYNYYSAYYNLEVYSSKKDHGIVYLRHKWDLKLP